MTAEDALRDVRGYAAASRFRVTRHAQIGMRERGATFGDVQHALVNAETCATEGARWRVNGADRSGDELLVVVALDDGVVVVTVF